MQTRYQEDVALVQALRDGRAGTWNRFVGRFSDTVLNLLRSWCESTCRRPRDQYRCILQVLREGRGTDTRETCDEAVDMYLFTFQALRNRILKYQGKSSLSTYITALMRFIHHDYFRQKLHRISIPAALKGLSEQDREVYKLMRRGREVFEIACELGVSAAEAQASRANVRRALRDQGVEWEHLDGWLETNRPPLSLVAADPQDGTEAVVDIPIDDRPPEHEELLSRLREAFSRLTLVQQRILDLRFARDYSAEQIAEKGRRLPVLGVTDPKEVYRAIDRALIRWLELVRAGYGPDAAGEPDVKEVKEVLPDLFRLAVFRPSEESGAGRAVKEP